MRPDADGAYSAPDYRVARLHHQVGRRQLAKESDMPKVVMTHKVVEVERWLKGKDERAAAMAAYATDVTDYVAMDGSNDVAISADIHDLAGAQAMMASPSADVAAQAESHGVVPPITVYIER
jgi:hypothetical protein